MTDSPRPSHPLEALERAALTLRAHFPRTDAADRAAAAILDSLAAGIRHREIDLTAWAIGRALDSAAAVETESAPRSADTAASLAALREGRGEGIAESLAADLEHPEDRIVRRGFAAVARDFAAAVRDAIDGERLEILAAAASILADRIEGEDPEQLLVAEREALAAAVRRDWATPA